MKKQEIETKIIELAADQLGYQTDDINLDSNLVNGLGADSLDEIEILMSIEEEFDIEIPDEEGDEIKTVGQAVGYVFDKLEGV